jgi:hypothetical protein
MLPWSKRCELILYFLGLHSEIWLSAPTLLFADVVYRFYLIKLYFVCYVASLLRQTHNYWRWLETGRVFCCKGSPSCGAMCRLLQSFRYRWYTWEKGRRPRVLPRQTYWTKSPRHYTHSWQWDRLLFLFFPATSKTENTLVFENNPKISLIFTPGLLGTRHATIVRSGNSCGPFAVCEIASAFI